MAVIRINKTNNYTVMSNYHFKEKNMSLKAKGLLSLMLSLPDDWDYSIEGLVTICKENHSSLRATLKELEEFSYLVRTRIQNTKGQFEYTYDIFEKPLAKKPYTENLYTENPYTENQRQLNTKKLNTNTNNSKKKNKFVPPTLEEVKQYCEERGNKVDAQYFYDYFTVSNWVDSKGNQVKNWKQKIITWERNTNNINTNNNSNTGEVKLVEVQKGAFKLC